MNITKFSVEGMTCESCVAKVTEALQKIPHVQSVKVNLNDKIAIVEAHHLITLNQAQEVLKSLPKYKIQDYKTESMTSSVSTTSEKDSWFKTYKPLITVFIYIILVSVSFQIYLGQFNGHLFMNHLMGGFFIGLSFFKFLDLNAFAESFSSYDPVARRYLAYGKVYPFIEIILGLLFLTGVGLVLANFLTIIVLSFTTYGVIKRLKSPSKIQCACLGSAFNLPLSYVTVTENLIMVLMAGYSFLKWV